MRSWTTLFRFIEAGTAKGPQGNQREPVTTDSRDLGGTIGHAALNSFAWIMAAVIGVAVVLGVYSYPRDRVLAAPNEPRADSASPVSFDAGGRLRQPAGYREWIYVGTPLTPHDMNDGQAAFPEFHSVYLDPAAYDHYQKTGVFPNGTVLVKELISVGTKQASSGNGYFMGDFTGLEVLIKDKQRFRDEPGHWGFFSFGHEYPLQATAKMQATANCNDCHSGLADDDFVFTQYYPVLRAAKHAAKSK